MKKGNLQRMASVQMAPDINIGKYMQSIKRNKDECIIKMNLIFVC